MNGEVIHEYDDAAGLLILANGKRVKVDSARFSSAEQAHREVSDWAKRTGLIGQNDEVICFI